MENQTKPLTSYVRDMVQSGVITPDFGLLLLRSSEKEREIHTAIGREIMRGEVYKIFFDEEITIEEAKIKLLTLK